MSAGVMVLLRDGVVGCVDYVAESPVLEGDVVTVNSYDKCGEAVSCTGTVDKILGVVEY